MVLVKNEPRLEKSSADPLSACHFLPDDSSVSFSKLIQRAWMLGVAFRAN
jgi:hypothetical protein